MGSNRRKRLKVARRDGLECAGGCGTRADSIPHAATIFTLDHIIPRAWGGESLMDNYQLMCPSCNSHKGARIEVLEPLGAD